MPFRDGLSPRGSSRKSHFSTPAGVRRMPCPFSSAAMRNKLSAGAFGDWEGVSPLLHRAFVTGLCGLACPPYEEVCTVPLMRRVSAVPSVPDSPSHLESLRVQGRSAAAIRIARPRQRLHTGMIQPGHVAEGFEPAVRIAEEGDTRAPVQSRGIRFEVV